MKHGVKSLCCSLAWSCLKTRSETIYCDLAMTGACICLACKDTSHKMLPSHGGWAQVDCVQQAALCREHHITGFPSIRVFRSGHDDITVHGMRDHEVAAHFHNQASHVHPCRNTPDNGTPHGVARQCHMLDLPMCFGAPASWDWLATYSLKPHLATHYIKP